jgi:hypothetical protein
MFLHLERVLHRVQFVDTGQRASFELRPDGHGARADDQFVVGGGFDQPIRSAVRNGFPSDVDPLYRTASPDVDSFELSTMRQTVPVGRFAAEKEWETANAVVRKIVGKENADLCVWVYLSGAQGRTNSRVTSAYDSYAHGFPH